ncbi:hypothetical protein L211DRAFT_832437 [Terfezia boudieri ATCC MYA-4762]|uniref:Uncharacterized protein n=1 Tax=Terfezia boudieri ATCC MYA-4762 TaxID=1051890 RepID=A0A3N4M400_9PEZI|nr:hypothetical protein L211DRAFT_832437 [Terfezia boudieri ATCC MYA-4762]
MLEPPTSLHIAIAQDPTGTAVTRVLAEHIGNRMKEGLSGEMALGEVDTSTMQLYVWALFEYTHVDM